MPLLTYIAEISPRPVLLIHGENAHSRYFSETAYAAAAEPKELMIIPGANHVDLYDRVDVIPFDRLAELLRPASRGVSDARWACVRAQAPCAKRRRRQSHVEINLGAAASRPGIIGAAMAQEHIRISSDWGEVTADSRRQRSRRRLARDAAADDRHARPSSPGKDRHLPSGLPELARQRDFSTGTLGLWSSNHFVIYYRDGRVPAPGIIILGQVTGDVSIFDRPGPVTVRVQRAD